MNNTDGRRTIGHHPGYMPVDQAKRLADEAAEYLAGFVAGQMGEVLLVPGTPANQAGYVAGLRSAI